jgi:hypothetical protein
MKQLFEICYKNTPDEWLTKQELRAVIENEGIMSGVDLNTLSEQTKFGLKIDRFVNRIMSEILMTVDSMEQRASRRKYKFTKNYGVFGTQNISDSGKVGKVETKVDLSNTNIKVDKVVPKNSSSVQNFDKNLENFEKNDENFDKNDKKLGSLGGFGTGSSPVYNAYSDYDRGTNLTILTEVAKSGEPPKKLESLADFSQKYKDVIRKEQEQIKEKSDRELQFYESQETSDIISKCTKEQVLEWIKNNPKVSFQKMYEALGLGSFKHIEDLSSEGIIKRVEEGWEVTNVS